MFSKICEKGIQPHWLQLYANSNGTEMAGPDSYNDEIYCSEPFHII